MDLHTAISVSMVPGSRARVSRTLKALREYSAPTVEDLLDALGLPQHQHAAIASEARRGADTLLEASKSSGMRAISCFDAEYPALLGCIADPPPVLWIRGDAAVLACPSVAMVGSRAATAYALQVGARLGAELAERRIVVTSGLARGVDSAAHRGCIDAGGFTVAVLGSGVDRIYPAEHEELGQRIAAHGAVISELGPGAPPVPEHFPLRNRIISGLSLGVVVVEASENSGSLITARCALEQGRDVLAVPGSVLTGRNRGSHALLKDGAKVVETADDILEELGWPGSAGQMVAQPFRAASAPAIASKQLNSDPLLARMEAGEVYRLDELVASSGMQPSRLLTRLTELELTGQVATAGGGRFRRLVT